MKTDKKNEDPITYGDLLEVESRLSKLEIEVEWLKASLKELKVSIDRIKWWIILGFFGSATFIYVLSLVVR